MCFKKIAEWFKPDPIIPVEGSKIALIFTIGNYPGSQNDLDGPPYDSENVLNFLIDNYPDFAIINYSDSEVTRSRFENTIKAQISTTKSGDILLIYYSGHGTNGYDSSEPDGYKEGLYLYDGTYWDDQFTAILQNIPTGAKVIIALDSCFAHGSTEPKGNPRVYRKSKFVPTQKISKKLKRIKPILKSDMMNYIVFAACGEDQTSADAVINGKPCGAFTYFWLKAWNKNFNYINWNNETVRLIKTSNQFDQKPNLEGDINLQEQIIFT